MRTRRRMSVSISLADFFFFLTPYVPRQEEKGMEMTGNDCI